MLVDLAKQAQDAAKAQFDLDGNTDAYRATLEASRQALIDRAKDLGATEEEARALADQIFRIPDETEWDLIANTEAASRTIEDFKTRYGVLQGVINYRAVQSVETGAERPGRAFGGAIYGPGTGTSDEAGLYRLSNGEHVITAAEVQALGGHAAVEAMRAAARAGQWDRGQHMVPTSPMYAAPVGGGSGSSFTFPETITLVDADGSILTRARVIAGDAVATYDATQSRVDDAGRRKRF
jgi:hypothetical protein